jgi:hypothetical protein
MEGDSSVTHAVGFAQVSLAGTLCFYTPLASRKLQHSISDWAKNYMQTNPVLGRLKDSEMVILSAGGSFGSRFSQPELWDGFVSSPVKGTLSESSAVLSSLTPGEDVWFWMTNQGPSGSHLLLKRQSEDPKGIEFAKEVSRFIRMCPTKVNSLKGLARWTEQQVLVFTSNDKPVGWNDGILELQKKQGFERLANARMAVLKDGTFVKSKRVTKQTKPQKSMSPAKTRDNKDSSGNPSHEYTAKAITNLGQGFWAFGREGLLIAGTKDELKEAIGKCFHNPPKIRGRVRFSDKAVTFATRQQIKGILPKLAKWILSQPGLDALHGCRLVQKDSDGQIIDKSNNPGLWS